MQRMSAKVLEASVAVPKEPQMIGALGAEVSCGKFREFVINFRRKK